MTKRPRRPSFADIVAEVTADAANRAEVPPARPGTLVGDQLIDPSGTRLSRDRGLTPSEAAEEVQAGASVAVDSCGCEGYCPLEWLDPRELAVLRAGGNPRVDKRSGQSAWIQLWTSDEDPARHVVSVHGDARWGKVIPRR